MSAAERRARSALLAFCDRGDRLREAGELDRLILVELELGAPPTQKCTGTLRSMPACLAQARRFSM